MVGSCYKRSGNVTFVDFRKAPKLLVEDPRIQLIKEAERTPTIEFLPGLLQLHDEPVIGADAAEAAMKVIESVTQPELLPILFDLSNHPRMIFFETAALNMERLIRENPGHEAILSIAQGMEFDEVKDRHFRVWFYVIAAKHNPELVNSASISRFLGLLNSIVMSESIPDSDHVCLQDLSYFMGEYMVRKATWPLMRIIREEKFYESDKYAAREALENL